MSCSLFDRQTDSLLNCWGMVRKISLFLSRHWNQCIIPSVASK